MRGSLKAYKQVNVQAQASVANPHKIVQMLLAGAIEKIACAILAIEQQQLAKKGELLSRSMEIISHLEAALDRSHGEELVDNLSAIYAYCIRRLAEASASNDRQLLEEVMELLKTIKSGWDEIPAEHHHLGQAI
ncbi:flagellar export chaperone FliS [Ferrimonas senticii]|uniref:flagellar export chaperone FliS n=1 Tax=Ferrimonas senticii TaxID=394566 RepID=UPI0004895629|nr:flagellar export chaperone FliS [Ferrimonas senticii]